ncbi:type ISP restriction/modification enzyme [Qipengyuania sp. MTN3-11]|uniref:type ISP restriction/modification enzyme n=1 Tax=Qipengyuania sp. MTN3-11 TaxID=3056557 RepID=UPI0036F2588E
MDGLGIHSGHQFDLLGGLSDENIERVKRQNRRKISVIIGNPPYNANQQNERENNKNRTYPHIDDRIKRTYIKESTAQKTKLYDMYSRFYRWASDRLGDEGIIAFITNRSFIESRTFDGFRKVVASNFDDIRIVDLGGDVRANPSLSGPTHNVFAIQTGVAIMFLVRNKVRGGSELKYVRRPEEEHAEDKLSWLGRNRIDELATQTIKPNDKGTWLNQIAPSEWDDFLPIADKKTKSDVTGRAERAIFKLFSLGVVTARDEWVYAREKADLEERLPYFLERYQGIRTRLADLPKNRRRDAIGETEIKLTRALKNNLVAGTSLRFSSDRLRRSLYRPFQARWLYFSSALNEMPYRNREFWPDAGSRNRCIAFLCGNRLDFAAIGTDITPAYSLMSLDPNQGIARYRYTKSGERIDNITDWALNRFTRHYGKKAGVTKDAIFAYCYAILHDPVYREKYALNLKREFPRIPFYPDFVQWVEWGEKLLDLHIDYEEVDPYPLERVETPNPKRAEGSHPRPKLKSVLAEGAETGSVVVDEDTQITGIPAGAWDYRLGNRSAIDWVLDQHKEKKPRDPTIAAKFNTYRFADYKESMIDLLAKVVRVSVETNAVTDAMATLDRSKWDSP